MALTTAQYDIIRRIYDDNRMNAERIADEHTREIYRVIPEYKELSDRSATLSLEYTKKALNGDKSATGTLSALLKDIKERKAALLVKAGYGPDYLSPSYTCPECKDTGYIDGHKCRCFRQKEIKLLYEQSNMVFDSDTVDFSDMSEDYYSGEDLERFREARQKAVGFVSNFNSDYQNLLFYGTVGTGKSMLTSCIAGHLLKGGHSVVYFSAASLIDELAKSTFDRGSSRYERTEAYGEGSDPIYECELLIIDDLGTEITNNFTVAALFNLLNERALKKRSVIISTNLSLDTLQERYTDRIFSRLTGGFTLCRLSGPDIRLASRLAR